MRILFFRQPTGYSRPVMGFGLGIVATILKNAGHQVRVIDNNSLYYKVYSDRDLLDIIQEYKPDVIGFNVTIINAYRTYQTLSKIRNKFPGILTVAGGIHMKYSSEEALRYGFDIAVVREGEKVVAPLFSYLSNRTRDNFRKDLEAIPGVSFFRQDGSVHAATEFPGVASLDEVPFVDYDLFNIQDFYKTGYEPLAIEICGQRGCPNRCTFCSDEIIRADRRRVSVDHLFSYLQYLYDKYKMKYMFLNDNDFLFPRERAVDFCNRLIQSGLNKEISFACQARVDTPFDEDFARLLKEAGFCSLGLGVERLEPSSQRAIRKISDPAQVRRVASIIRKAKINVTMFMVAGFPFETVEILRAEERAFLELADYTKTFDVSILMPLPGTIYYDNYPGVKDWYLKPEALNITFSYYGQVYDVKMLGLVKQNFYNLPREVTRELLRFIMKFKRINHRNFVVKRNPLVHLMSFADVMVAQISRVFYWISPSLEAAVFSKVRYIRYYFATKLFGKKISEALD
jgi:anaerobic magnesium-protoporphyrin IX monomethyl ester cyclase